MTKGQTERVLFDRAQNVVITTARADFGGTTYALAQIVSVSMLKIPADRSTALVLAFLGFATAGLGAALEAVPMIALGVVLFVAGIAWAVTRKPKYAVRLLTGGSTVEAFVTDNENVAAEISVALKRAISER